MDFRERVDQAGSRMAMHVMEFIGTFFFVLTAGMTFPLVHGNYIAPLATGFVLIPLVYLAKHISGGHLNPALSFGLKASGRQKIAVPNLLAFVIVQLIAGILGALVAYALVGKTPSETLYVHNWLVASIAELLWTFLLVLLFLNVASTHSLEGNMFYGLAIGFVVLVGGLVVTPLGAFFNPALELGLHISSCIWGTCYIRFIPIYLICPPLGALLAAAVFRFCNRPEYEYREREESYRLVPDSG